jgi:hypothetical protein
MPRVFMQLVSYATNKQQATHFTTSQMAESSTNKQLVEQIEDLCADVAKQLYDLDIDQIKQRYEASEKLYNIREQCYNLYNPPVTKNNEKWSEYRDTINDKRHIKKEYDDVNKTRTGRCRSQFDRYQNDATLYETFKMLGDDRVKQLIDKHHITSWKYQMKKIEQHIKKQGIISGVELYAVIVNFIQNGYNEEEAEASSSTASNNMNDHESSTPLLQTQKKKPSDDDDGANPTTPAKSKAAKHLSLSPSSDQSTPIRLPRRTEEEDTSVAFDAVANVTKARQYGGKQALQKVSKMSAHADEETDDHKQTSDNDNDDVSLSQSSNSSAGLDVIADTAKDRKRSRESVPRASYRGASSSPAKKRKSTVRSSTRSSKRQAVAKNTKQQQPQSGVDDDDDDEEDEDEADDDAEADNNDAGDVDEQDEGMIPPLLTPDDSERGLSIDTSSKDTAVGAEQVEQAEEQEDDDDHDIRDLLDWYEAQVNHTPNAKAPTHNVAKSNTAFRKYLHTPELFSKFMVYLMYRKLKPLENSVRKKKKVDAIFTTFIADIEKAVTKAKNAFYNP